MEEKDINLRSEEMQELMGEIPPKILKVSIFLLVFFYINNNSSESANKIS